MTKPKFTTDPKGTKSKRTGEVYNTNYFSWLLPGASAFNTNMYVPQWFFKMFPGAKSSDPVKRKKALANAGVVENMIGSVLLASAVVGGVRWVMNKAHKAQLANLQSDNPADKLTSHVNTMYTFDPEAEIAKEEEAESAKQLAMEAANAQEEAAKKQDEDAKRLAMEAANAQEEAAKKQDEDAKRLARKALKAQEKVAGFKGAAVKELANTLRKTAKHEYVTDMGEGTVSSGLGYMSAGLLPTLAFLTAAGLMNNYASKEFGRKTAEEADKRLKRNTELRNRLIYARTANAKGKLTKKELDALNKKIEESGLAQHVMLPVDEEPKENTDQTKTASVLGEGWALASAAAASLLAMSFLGSYAYTSARDPRNIKYNAIKKGLKEYAKTKASTTPIYFANAASDPFAKLDADPVQEAQDAANVDQPGLAVTATPAQAVAEARNAPEIDMTSNYKPISVTL